MAKPATYVSASGTGGILTGLVRVGDRAGHGALERGDLLDRVVLHVAVGLETTDDANQNVQRTRGPAGRETGRVAAQQRVREGTEGFGLAQGNGLAGSRGGNAVGDGEAIDGHDAVAEEINAGSTVKIC